MPRILGVDDSAQNRTLIELYLQGTEFEVVTASSGHEALELCRRQEFDLILLDVMMPQLDGFEVCRRLKNDPRTAFVPVIFLTGRLGDESDRAAAYQLGAVDYIQKPVDRDELLARIRVMRRLEDARSRLDRENATLRRELVATQQDLAAAMQRLDGMLELRRELVAAASDALLLLDAGLTIAAADAAAEQLLGALPRGATLLSCGHGAARLAGLLRDGASSADLLLPQGERQARTLRVRVHALQDGCKAVVLQDVTGILAAERNLRDREIAAPPAPPRRQHQAEYAITDFVGAAPSVQELAEKVGRLRNNRSTVLIYGESGAGKELVARALHFDGRARSAPFIPMHCGAIAPELVESELFGHEKGSFTGAQQAREGLFEAADGGSIFLDEIAEMSLDIQVKLLRVLQRGEIRPVGASQPRLVDVRILAATNRDLLDMVRAGTFREDLYYRLEVVTLHVPPLRERMQDLPGLVEHFVRLANRRHDRLDRPVRGVSQAAMQRLLGYPWPGNVRELENVIEGAFALGVGEVLQEEDLPRKVVLGQPELVPRPVQQPRGGRTAPARVEVPAAAAEEVGAADLRTLRLQAEREAFVRALADCAGDKLAAAQHLGLSRSTFYRRLKDLDL